MSEDQQYDIYKSATFIQFANHLDLYLDLSICHEVFLLDVEQPYSDFKYKTFGVPRCAFPHCLHQKNIEILQGLETNCALGGSPPIYVGAREMETRFEVGLGITRNLLQRR